MQVASHNSHALMGTLNGTGSNPNRRFDCRPFVQAAEPVGSRGAQTCHRPLVSRRLGWTAGVLSDGVVPCGKVASCAARSIPLRGRTVGAAYPQGVFALPRGTMWGRFKRSGGSDGASLSWNVDFRKGRVLRRSGQPPHPAFGHLLPPGGEGPDEGQRAGRGVRAGGRERRALGRLTPESPSPTTPASPGSSGWRRRCGRWWRSGGCCWRGRWPGRRRRRGRR